MLCIQELAWRSLNSQLSIFTKPSNGLSFLHGNVINICVCKTLLSKSLIPTLFLVVDTSYLLQQSQAGDLFDQYLYCKNRNIYTRLCTTQAWHQLGQLPGWLPPPWQLDCFCFLNPPHPALLPVGMGVSSGDILFCHPPWAGSVLVLPRAGLQCQGPQELLERGH